MAPGKDGGTRPPSIVTVGKDWRIGIPQDICKAVPWFAGAGPLSAWLLLLRFGRYRLLSDQDVSSPSLEELRNRIAALASSPRQGPMVLGDDDEAMIPSRFFEVQLHWSTNNGWRLKLPAVTIHLWRLQQGNDHVVIQLSHEGYIEIWSMETLEAAFKVPLPDIL
jgi:hypothetical protein